MLDILLWIIVLIIILGGISLAILSFITPYPKRSRKDFMEKIYSYKKGGEFDNLLSENGSRIFTDPKCYLSIIIPAMNEQERIGTMLQECTEYLTARSKKEKDFTYEIIVVDDGSRDDTSEVAYTYAMNNLRVLKLAKNKGKGGAIRDGVLHCGGKMILFADADGATKFGGAIRDGVLHCGGKMILFADADGATKFSDIEKLENKFKEMVNDENEIDYTFPGIVVGSRCHLEEESIAERSLFRTILMKGFHIIVYLLTVKTVHDTQCGFKLFSRAAAARLFPLLHIERWAFDVELLYLAEKLHYPISEVAVEWKEVDGSKIVPIWSWLQMGRDILLIWIHYLTGKWSVTQ
uniref:dolichyl-phosphate beta-glucosyltransferase n=1 Tax=Strongyloides papillosus TaxID=174720 RepID=A0A0N5BK58_STREA